MPQRSLKLFRLFGINVYLHWSWLLGAAFVYLYREQFFGANYSLGFFALLYLSLFLIVLLHEFGHSLACKSVGGTADLIILQPLGGIAFVNPPQRPGAMLWSIVAGPLVNVILLPITGIPALLLAYAEVSGPVADFLYFVAGINLSLLVFNLLPFYPLDGGQILRSLLWFFTGRGLSLVIAASIGLVGATILAVFAFFSINPMLAAIVFLMGFQSYLSIRVGRAMMRMERAPRHDAVACPLCHEHPPVSPIWRCPCGATFDSFDTNSTAATGRCPQCTRPFETTACPFCNKSSPHSHWHTPEAIPT